MKYFDIPDVRLKASNIILGCMHLKELSKSEANILIKSAIESGINIFDHADVYGNGRCETLFAEAVGMSDDFREKVIIQSKCGIRKDGQLVPAYYDFSKEYILKSVDGILQRLKTDYLDVLLLHRPDALLEPEEVADAFNELQAKGKVHCFGVSNQNPQQMELLQKSLNQKLAFNQLQLSMAHTPMVDAGMTVNMGLPQSIDRTGGILEYARLNRITVQAWSPFQWGMFAGIFLGDHERYPALNQAVRQMAEKHGVPDEAIAVAWITHHPANMQVIIGTTKVPRMQACCQGADLPLTREEWYFLYKAAGNPIP